MDMWMGQKTHSGRGGETGGSLGGLVWVRFALANFIQKGQSGMNTTKTPRQFMNLNT